MNPNSALIWFPVIEQAGLPVPKTAIVPYSHHGCLSIFDGEPSDEFSRLCDAVKVAAVEIGYPVFLRTDLSSAKHSGPDAFRADSDAEISRCLGNTIEDNEMKFWMERHGPTAFLVRQYLPLRYTFTAFRQTPIAREFRLFATGDGCLCEHPYWPEDAIEGFIRHDAPEDWREQLARMNEFPAEMPELRAMAIKAAGLLGGAWSVDFAQDVDGKWWVPDMATARDSYHWPRCPQELPPAPARPRGGSGGPS